MSDFEIIHEETFDPVIIKLNSQEVVNRLIKILDEVENIEKLQLIKPADRLWAVSLASKLAEHRG